MSSNFQHKHKASTDPSSSRHLIDLGRTPVWYPPPSYQQESSIRPRRGPRHSTQGQARPSSNTSHSSGGCGATSSSFNDHQEHTFEPPPPECLTTVVTFTPINQNSATPQIMPTGSEEFSQRYNRHLFEFNVDMYDIEESQVRWLGKSDGRVYHFNHKGGAAYSGTFAEDKPLDPEVQDMIEKMLDKRNVSMREKARPEAEQHVRQLLSWGHSLVLERVEPDDADVHCGLLGCLCHASPLPPATYYFVFRQLGVPGCQSDKGSDYCLACMEWLWKAADGRQWRHPGIVPGMERDYLSCSEKGEGMVADHTLNATEEASRLQIDGVGKPTWSHREPSIPQFDGDWKSPCYSELASEPGSFVLSSRHAPQSPGSYTSTPAFTHLESDDDDDGCDSPRSMDSTGNWFYPPTRFQHIAAFVKPGVTLSTKEKAAVWLWKAASQDQLRWDKHMQDTESRRKHFSGLEDAEKTKEPEIKIEDHDHQEEDIALWEELTGVRKKDCHGNDLSEILNKAMKHVED